MKADTMLGAACLGLTVALAVCTSASGHASPTYEAPDGQHGMVITVGSFGFPESVLLAGIYGQALAAAGWLRVHGLIPAGGGAR